jgi:uncharacterized protein (DUF849 family)
MLKKIWALVVAMVAVIAAGGVVNATEGPKVEYSADSYMETAEAVMKAALRAGRRRVHLHGRPKDDHDHPATRSPSGC